MSQNQSKGKPGKGKGKITRNKAGQGKKRVEMLNAPASSKNAGKAYNLQPVQSAARVSRDAPTSYYYISNYSDAKNGIKHGIQVDFCGPVVKATNSATSSGGFVTYWGAYNTLFTNATLTVTGGNPEVAGFTLNPWTCLPRNSPAAAAEGYARFMFTKLTAHWHGLVNTGNNANFGISYNPDGEFSVGDLNGYSGMISQAVVDYVPAWTERSFSVTPYLNKKDWFYTDFVTIPLSADGRQTYQGILSMIPSGNQLISSQVGIDMGTLFLEGTILMIDPMTFGQDVALSGRNSLRKASMASRGYILSKQIKPKDIPKAESKSDYVEVPRSDAEVAVVPQLEPVRPVERLLAPSARTASPSRGWLG